MLSICIVNWNTKDYLRDCLASLYAHPPQDEAMEVIVVDNASTDGSAAMVEAEFPQTVLIASSENLGYAEGNNRALERAAGEAVLLLNPDVVVYPETLTNALVFLRAHPQAGAVGAKQIGADGEIQSSLRSFPDPLPVLWEYLRLPKLFPKSRTFGAYRMTWFDYQTPIQADQPMGTFLLLRREALDQVGRMDPQFPIFFNEVDWCWRAKRERGWEIWYAPDVALTHYGGGSTRQVKPQMIRESHQSLLRFYDKHYKGRVPPLLFALIRAAVVWNERRLTGRTQKKPPGAEDKSGPGGGAGGRG